MNNSSYINRPMLRLLECYILHAIGCLPEETEIQLRKLEPGLASTFGRSGRWFELIAHKMEFTDELSDYLRTLWEQNLSSSTSQTKLSSEQFAQYIVDSNFSNLV